MARLHLKLNFLEAIHMSRIIPLLMVDQVFIDAPDTNPARFSSELSDMLDPCPKLVAEHRADRNYVVVSAASIVAKVERDRAVELLRTEHGEFGLRLSVGRGHDNLSQGMGGERGRDPSVCEEELEDLGPNPHGDALPLARQDRRDQRMVLVERAQLDYPLDSEPGRREPVALLAEDALEAP